MKISATFLFIALPGLLFAQKLKITGTVLDAQTHLPIIYANVQSASALTITNYSGAFLLDGLTRRDTIKVTCVGYRPYTIAYNKIKNDTITIYLHQGSMMLNDVNVRARHSFKQDSLNLRKQYADVFNYKGPGFEDMFITVDPYAKPLYTYNTTLKNATQLININLLQVIAMLGKNNAPVSKLQQTLIEDEQNTYVDQRFSKEKITELTGLKDDSLSNFMSMYRPPIADTKKMSDYQMMLYIKKSYQDFLKNYDPKKALFAQ